MSQVIAIVEESVGRVTGVLNLLISLIPTTTSTTTIAPPTTTTTAPPPTTTTTVNEATFPPTTAAPGATVPPTTAAAGTTLPPTTAAPVAADLLKIFFGQTEEPTTTTQVPEDPLIAALLSALWGEWGPENRGDPIKAVVDELTMKGDRHNCFGLFDGIVDSVMGIAGPILGLGQTTEREVKQFIKQSAREAEQMGLFEAISQIMAVTGMPIPDTCKCDCGCRAAPAFPAAARIA